MSQNERTKKIYEASRRRFIRWLHRKKPEEYTDPEYHVENFPLERVSAQDIKTYLEERYVGKAFEGVKAVGKSAIGVERSALLSFYRERAIPQPQNLHKSLSQLIPRQMDGPNRRSPKNHPLPFALYTQLSQEFFWREEEQVVWGHCYALLNWVTMGRANQVEGIRLEDLSWVEDCLVLSHRPTPIHIYANPLIPQICPILSLGLHFLYFSCGDDGKLFAGRMQSGSFSALLLRLLRGEWNEIVSQAGCDPSSLGTSSYQRGSMAYASSFCPFLQPIYRRSGVEGEYDKEGDQHIGRIVSGLPLNEVAFAVPPPRFHPLAKDITQAIQSSFSDGLVDRPTLEPVLKMCLASIIYHSQWLRTSLPSSSPFLQCFPLNCPAVLLVLQTQLLPLYDTSDGIHLTGIPTNHPFYEKESNCEEEENPTPLPVGEESGPLPPPYSCDEDLCFPHEWRLPTVNVEVGWQLWWLGDPVNKVPPLRNVEGSKHLAQEDRRKFCEWRATYGRLEKALAMKNKLVSSRNPTIAEVRSMFLSVLPLIRNVSPVRGKTRQQRITTVAKRIRIEEEEFCRIVNEVIS